MASVPPLWRPAKTSVLWSVRTPVVALSVTSAGRTVEPDLLNLPADPEGVADEAQVVDAGAQRLVLEGGDDRAVGDLDQGELLLRDTVDRRELATDVDRLPVSGQRERGDLAVDGGREARRDDAGRGVEGREAGTRVGRGPSDELGERAADDDQVAHLDDGLDDPSFTNGVKSAGSALTILMWTAVASPWARAGTATRASRSVDGGGQSGLRAGSGRDGLTVRD